MLQDCLHLQLNSLMHPEMTGQKLHNNSIRKSTEDCCADKSPCMTNTEEKRRLILPTKKIKVEGAELTALVDTGASARFFIDRMEQTECH